MIFVTFAFFLATLIIGGAQIAAGEVWPGASFLLGGLFAYWAGSSLKLGLLAVDPKRRRVGLALTALFAALAVGVVLASGVRFDAYGHDMPGVAWIIAGLIAGILGTRRRRALAPPPAA